MANKYGEAAITAARSTIRKPEEAVERWNDAVAVLYRTSPVAQKKGGPRGAFLGLCEEGLIQGIAPGHYTNAKDNKRFAVAAVATLREGSCPATVNALWRHVTGGSDQEHASQMDVVLALWKNKLIA